MIESFVVESWLEHERQHGRISESDKAEQDALAVFYAGEMPQVRHFLRPE